MKNFLATILKDKSGEYSMREVVVAIFVAATLIAWASEQFFRLTCPEYMFYGFISLVATGCFGYSIEKNALNLFKPKTKNETEQTK